jgi:hypothetical protein
VAGEPPAYTAVTPPTAMAARPMPAMIVRGCRMLPPGNVDYFVY